MLGLPACAVRGEDFSTTNRQQLARFWQLLESKSRPVTVLSFGDSMADSYRSVTYYLFRRLEERFGTAGYSLNNYRNTLGFYYTNGATYLPASNRWYVQNYLLPAGGGMWWENEASSKGLFSDQVGVFYLAQPEGGLFTLSVSTNQGPWGTHLTLDGYSATPVGRYTNVVLAPNWHRLRVDGLTGTNYFLGPQALLRSSNGLHIAFTDGPGISLTGVTNISRAIRDPIMAGLKPDLLIWHMKEPADAGLVEQMKECEDWWRTTNPEGAVLYIGTTWTVYDNDGSVLTTDFNRIIRNIALAHNRAYVDLMQPAISYDWMFANGYILDGVHLTPAGAQWAMNVLWNDLNFFALGIPRHLSLQKLGEELRVTYPTSTGVSYTVLSSANLQSWSPLTNTSGNGQMQIHALPAHDNGFFRLQLRPAD